MGLNLARASLSDIESLAYAFTGVIELKNEAGWIIEVLTGLYRAVDYKTTNSWCQLLVVWLCLG
ncbi:hypothetical protein R50076_35440 [Gilvimarinus japonicus]